MIGSRALRRLANQLVLLVAVVLAATALTYVVTEVLPGDAAIAILGDTAPDQIASLRPNSASNARWSCAMPTGSRTQRKATSADPIGRARVSG